MLGRGTIRLMGKPPAHHDSPRDGAAQTTDVVEPAPNTPTLADEPLPYRSWDRYKLVSFLGVGGTGAVYQAYDPRMHRNVAIKLLRGRQSDASSTRQRRQLEREARAQARIEHPHIYMISSSCRNSDGIAQFRTK